MKLTRETKNATAPVLMTPLTIAFVGSKGVGKSGVINSLLTQGKSTKWPLPSYLGSQGVTRDFFRVSFTEGEFTLCDRSGGNKKVFSVTVLAEVLPALNKVPKSDRRRTFDLTGPFPGLSPLLTLIDCPGWGDATLYEFYQALHDASAIVTVSARFDEMHEALFLGLGAHASAKSRALPLFVNAAFYQEEEQNEADFPPIGHPLAQRFLVKRDTLNLAALVHQVNDHAVRERNRAVAFYTDSLALAKGDGSGAMELLRRNDTKAEHLRKILTQFQEDMFALNGALPQPFDQQLGYDQDLAAMCCYSYPSRLLLHLAFTFENQFRAKLQAALEALLAASGITASNVAADWSLRKRSLDVVFSALALAKISDSDEEDLEARWLAAHAALVPYRRALRELGCEVIQEFEGELGFLRLK